MNLIKLVFNTILLPKYDGYQRGLASMVYKFFDKKSYADHKDLINRTEADKVLRDKAYGIANNKAI